MNHLDAFKNFDFSDDENEMKLYHLMLFLLLFSNTIKERAPKEELRRTDYESFEGGHFQANDGGCE